MADFDLDLLERHIDALIEQNRLLRGENTSLRQRLDALMAERGELIEKTELARSRIEAMLSRLRAMEEHL